MRINAKTVWGSILCVLGTIAILNAFYIYQEIQDTKLVSMAMQSMVDNFGKEMSRFSGAASKYPQLELSKDRFFQKGMAELERRAFISLVGGIFIALVGTMMLLGDEEKTNFRNKKSSLETTDLDIPINR